MAENEVEQFYQFAREFWQWRAFYQPTSSDDIPRIERPEGWEPDWSAAAVEKQHEALGDFEARWQGFTVSDWTIPQQVDYRLIGSAIARVYWELDVLCSWQRNPRFYVYQTLGAIFEELLMNKPFDEKRSAEIVRRFARIPKLLEDGKANLEGNAIKPFTVATLELFQDLRPRLAKVVEGIHQLLAPSCAEQIVQAGDEAILALESFRDWLEEHLPAMETDAEIGGENYSYFLKEVALMPYTPEQLVAMARQEWERSIAFEAFARERAKAEPELPLFESQAAQIGGTELDEIKIRKFLEDRNILTVPDWMQHYINMPMPAYIEPLAGLGVVDDLTSPTRLHQNGLRYIPQPSMELGYFELSAALDPRPLIVHEGVPGHYFQMTLSWAHENEVRRYYYDSGANEGIGFYAEEMMLQMGLFDDSPRSREIMCNFMRLRALRVEVDVKLALGEFTIDQATEYLQTKTPMDYATARSEAVFFASLPGQAITYQIGKLQIVKFLADARQQLGDEFNLRAFHDFLWKNGNNPISLLRWEYLGLDDEIALLDEE